MKLIDWHDFCENYINGLNNLVHEELETMTRKWSHYAEIGKEEDEKKINRKSELIDLVLRKMSTMTLMALLLQMGKMVVNKKWRPQAN